jgi:tetratricopeptide (TPR) repeat protein
MASTPSENKGRQPLSPQKRQMLQQWFTSGSRSSAKGDFDYATEMFAQCVLADPGNLVYAQNFIGNLQKKFNNNKKGSSFAGIRGAGAKGAIQKARLSKDWQGVLKHGFDMLKLNPWEVSCLQEMAHACAELEYDECEVFYLKAALEFDIKDAEVNRRLGRALEKQGQFDAATVCWKRVLAAKGRDDEASRSIANLSVKKTIHEGGYEGAQSSQDVMADEEEKDELFGGVKLTPEQKLMKAIAKAPEQIGHYTELAELYLQKEQFNEAEEWYNKALAISGNDLGIRERIEDIQVRRTREQVLVAEKKYQSSQSEEDKTLWQSFRKELLLKELEYYRIRSERYPTNLGHKYELADRLRQAGQVKEAIPLFQKALGDARRKGQTHLMLGDCFERIQQAKLAMSNYELAVQELSLADEDFKKKALYRAGSLAIKLNDLDKAEKHLTDLAGLDFSYKDVSERLDKIAEIRNSQGST